MTHIQDDQGNNDELVNATPGPIDVEVYESFDAAAAMQREWDEFIESIDGEIFLTYDWCRIWWKYYGTGRELRIFVIRRDKAVIGILPVFLERLGIGPVRLRVIRFVGTDHMPVTIMFPVDSRYMDEIVTRFIGELNRQYRWDLLYIGALCGRFNETDRLASAVKNIGANDYCVDVKTADVQTYFHLSESWEQQLAGLKKKQRQNINRAYKLLNTNNGAVRTTFSNAESAKRDFANFLEMHQRQWQADGAAGHFGDWPNSSEFHSEVVSCQVGCNRLRLMKIEVGDECLGYKYGYRLGKTSFQFLSARNTTSNISDAGFTQVAFGEQTKKAIEAGVTCIDSMRGHYPHKIHLGGVLYPTRHIYIYPRKGITAARVFAFRNAVGLFDMLYNKIWRRRVMPILGMKPGPFHAFWIKTHQLSPHRKA
jgi:CelD/BcsL family acetyltransferase involved in cellulose biosynthesis